MSAYMCSNAHINALATFAALHNVYVNHGAVHWRGAEHAHEIAQALYHANADSINSRYPGDNEGSEPFTFKQTMNKKHLTPLVIAKLCSCYDYQACEVDDYELTLACAITSAIVKTCVSQLPGYDAAPWGIDDDEITPPAPALKVVAPPKPADDQFDDGPF